MDEIKDDIDTPIQSNSRYLERVYKPTVPQTITNDILQTYLFQTLEATDRLRFLTISGQLNIRTKRE